MDKRKIKTRNIQKEEKKTLNPNEKKSYKISGIASKQKMNPMKLKNIRITNNEKNNNNNNCNKTNLEIDNNEFELLDKKTTCIEMNKIHRRNKYTDELSQKDRNFCCRSFLVNCSNPMKKYINISNKMKYFLNRANNKKNNLVKSIRYKSNNITNIATNISQKKIETERLFNNNNVKLPKNKIELYSNKLQNSKNEITSSKYDISSLLNINRRRNNKENKSIKKKLIKEKKFFMKKEIIKETEELNSIFDIESEHKNSINLKNFGDYQVNKPQEQNMKFSLLKEYEDDDKENADNKKAEKIVIGDIEGYQDIIESDKLNDLNETIRRDKKKGVKKIILNENNKVKKTKKKIKIDKIAKYFEKFCFIEDNSTGFNDFILENNYCQTHENLLNIEKEYEFEDLPTNENDSKINKVMFFSRIKK